MSQRVSSFFDRLSPGYRVFRRWPAGLTALLVILALYWFTGARLAAADGRPLGDKIPLYDHWQLQSSCVVTADGSQISTEGYSTTGWHTTTVPSTVLAALVADKTYSDPYFGTNLRSLPGGDHPAGRNFSRLPMPKDSPYRCSWWYRTEFELPASFDGQYVWIDFGGINYRANIWLNGKKVASDSQVAGAYRTYELDITSFLNRKGRNVLAVETFAQTEKDLGINWVDWNPAPPDKDMGLWRGVFLRASGPVAVRHPSISTHLPKAGSLAEADVTIQAELKNTSPYEVKGMLEGTLGEISFRQPVTLKASELRPVDITPGQFPALKIQNPKLWWPYAMGAQNLYPLTLRFIEGGKTDDIATARVGVREITSELDANGHLLFRVNGEKILIRGGGWSPDMLLREDPKKLATEFEYVRDLNLNTIRLEGKMETEDFFNLADEQGILVMAGWCCCDHWEEWKDWKPGDLEIAADSVKSQTLRMRSHPSLLVWLNGSDNPPPRDVERAYLAALKFSEWPNPVLSSASQQSTKVTGPSGVKMTGPYDYVPPDYWLLDTTKYGGAFGFNTETGPGPSVPPLSCLRKFLPEANIKPDDPVWNFHAGLEGFQNLDHFDGAMNAIYGKPADFATYEIKAQTMAYDAERAMFEAYSRNKYISTGVIQWMLNNAWPSLIWHLYDYYLQPAGAYFGTKKACEPIHVQYSYDDRSVVVVNSRYESTGGLKLSARLYDSSLKELFSRDSNVSVDADGIERAFTIPVDAFVISSPIYFLKLELRNETGDIVSSNFYWLSAKKNEYEWKKTDYKYTPVSSYEDLTALNSLPSAQVSATVGTLDCGANTCVAVTLKNTSAHLAFRLRSSLRDEATHQEIRPVLWSDNYIDLMPGETRRIVATIDASTGASGKWEVAVAGWNVAENVTPVEAKLRTMAVAARQSREGGK